MSLRTRLLLLVLLATLPLAAALIYVHFQDRNERIAEAKRGLTVLAHLTTQDLEARLRAASQLAFGLAQDRQIDLRDRAACSAHLAEIYRRFPEFISITVFLPNGDLRCTSLREWKQANVADRLYFKRALASNEPQYEALVSRVSGASVALVAYAARDALGSVKFILTMGVNLERFVAESAKISQYNDRVTTLWGDDGTLLARFPEDEEQKLAGRKLPESDLYRFVRDNPSGATGEVKGLDGIVRVYALAALPKVQGTELRFTLGVSRAELVAEADRQLRNALLFSGVLLVLAVVSVWQFAERGIRRPTARILKTVKRVAGGDLAARIGRPYPRGEIGHLMEVVDDTAGTLQRQRRATEQAEAKLCESEARYHQLFAASPDAVFVLDRAGRFLDCNQIATQRYGYSRAELLQLTAQDLAAPDLREQAATRVKEAMTTGGAFEWQHRRKDGSELPVEISAKPLEIGGQMLVLANVRDITERKRAETALRESERGLTEAQRIAHIGSWSWNLTETTHWTDELYRVYGLSPETFTPTTEAFFNLVHPEDRPAMQEWLRACGAGESPGNFEFRAIRPDGTVRFISGDGELFRDAGGRPIHMAGTAQDITERKQAEASLRESALQLQMLSKRVIDAQETERRRLAGELHDELGQALTAIKINLQARERFKDHSPEVLDAENICIVDDALQQVRQLALALRPSMLDDLGLGSALRWMADQQAERGGFVVHFGADFPDTRLAPELETTCFRIAQEALTNIARHAQAKRVSIELRQAGDVLIMTIQDDGHGFDVAAMRTRATAGASIGLLGMQERATLAGGNLDIESSPKRGTILRARFPWRTREEQL